MNSCLILENGTESDCSNLFESFHPAFTIIQACVAVAFIIFGVSLNLVLNMALIKFFHLMDEAFILCISIFTANVLVSLTIGIGMFLSSITRRWPLGYVGCQLFGFISYWAALVRWVTLGMLSIDRFCRVFLPYCYPRYSRIVLKILLIVSWVVVLPINILALLKIQSKYDFTLTLPGCFFFANCNEAVICKTWQYTHAALVLASGSVLPVVIYTILYIKSRRLLNATQTPHASSQQQMEDNERQNKATQTFALMVITFSSYSATSLTVTIIQLIPVTRDISGLSTLLNDITLLYLLTDFLLVWKNKNGKQVIKKLINTVFGKQVCSSYDAIPAPTGTTAIDGQPSSYTHSKSKTDGHGRPSSCTHSK